MNLILIHGSLVHAAQWCALWAVGAPPWRWWCAAAGSSALAAAIVAGNLAALAALRRARPAPAHHPLASLAAADLLLGLLVVPLAAARELSVFHLHWIICSGWKTLDVLCCTASILSLCVLGWERWCGITAPLARARRAKLARILARLVWPVSFAVALPTAFITTPRHNGDEELVKACPEHSNVAYVFFSTILSFYVPTTVMLVMYARILYALASSPAIRSHRGRTSSSATRQKSNNSTRNIMASISRVSGRTRTDTEGSDIELPPSQIASQPNVLEVSRPNVRVTLNDGGLPLTNESRQRSATRTIVRLMSLFLVCWTPFFVMLPVDSVCDCVGNTTWQWCTWLGYTNSALNPIVYAAASPSIRRAFRALLTFNSTRNDVPLSSSGRRA